jgi:hypothetical protein
MFVMDSLFISSLMLRREQLLLSETLFSTYFISFYINDWVNNRYQLCGRWL